MATNNEIEIFSHQDFGDITSVTINKTVFFKANEIATALGYTKTRNAISAHCKRVKEIEVKTKRGFQPTQFIPIPDVFRLMMRSQLEEAERFQDWVCEEVLPSIYEDGFYTADEKGAEVINEWQKRLDHFKVRSQKDLVVFHDLVQITTDLKLCGESARLAELTGITKAAGLMREIGREMLSEGLGLYDTTPEVLFEKRKRECRKIFRNQAELRREFMRFKDVPVSVDDDHDIIVYPARTKAKRFWRFEIVSD